MILGHNEIHNRISKGEVFRKGTSDPGCVKEASYVLRIAADGLLLDGKFYDPFSQKKLNRFQMLVRNVGATTVQKLTEPRMINVNYSCRPTTITFASSPPVGSCQLRSADGLGLL